jgi:hypothetical protein
VKKIVVVLALLTLIPEIQSQDFREKDKQLHLAAGTVFGALGYHMYYKEYGDVQGAVLAGLASGFAAGTAKELDTEDLLATVLGSFTISVVIPLFKLEKKKFKQRKRRPKNRKRKCGI